MAHFELKEEKMAFTGKNLTREEMEELIETLLCTDLNNEDTAHLIMEIVEFYICRVLHQKIKGKLDKE